MLKYESFNLPGDGLTRISKVDGYEERQLRAEGWTMVGLAEASFDKEQGMQLFGIYRLTETEALRVALDDAEKARKRADDAENKARDLERQLKDVTTRAADLSVRADKVTQKEAIIARARERFGQAFTELEAG